MEKYRDDPEYCEVLRTVLKSQIKQLVEQLSFYGGEEAVLLSASISDGTLSHIGSKSGQQFLNTHSHVKSQFLGFCLKGARDSSLSSPFSETGGRRPEASSTFTGKPPAKRPRISDSDELYKSVHKHNKSVTKEPSEVDGRNRSQDSSSHVASATCTNSGQDTDSVNIVGETPGHSAKKAAIDSLIDMECSDDTEGYSESIGIFSPDIVKETLAEIKQEPVYEDEGEGDGNIPSDFATNPELACDHMMANTSRIKEEGSITDETSSDSDCSDTRNKDMFKFSESRDGTTSFLSQSRYEELISNYQRKRKPRAGPRKLNICTIKTKYEAILAVEAGEKRKCEIAKDFNIPQNTLSTWLKSAEEIKNNFLKGLNPNRKSTKGSWFPDIEQKILEWTEDAKTYGIPISNLILMEKANEFARDLGYTEDQFDCTKGWIGAFKKRYALSRPRENYKMNKNK